MGETEGRRIVGTPSLPGGQYGAGRTWVLLAPGVIALALTFVAPLLLFGAYAFARGGLFTVTWDFTLDNFVTVLTDPFVGLLIVRSLVTGFIVAGICLVIALPLAFYLRFRAGRLETPLFVLLVVALFVSYLARIYAWRALFTSSGVFTVFIESLGVTEPPQLLFTRTLVVIALVHIYLPFVTLAIYAAMRNLPRTVLEVAEDLGATGLTSWRRVILPLMASTSLAPFMFTLGLAASDFATPQLLGGTKGTLVGVLVQQQFAEAGNFPMGAAMSLVLLAVFVLLYFALTSLLFATRLHRVSVRL